MKALEDPDALVLHQVHPAKLAADASASVASMWLLWRGRTATGFAVHYLVPLVASAVVLHRDLSPLRETARGRYVLANMPPPAQAVRALGDTLMVRGARRHQRKLIALGALVIAAGWSRGLLSRRNARNKTGF
ncbi:MAG TPA: hypothetical protein VJ456_04610 [Acidimicrobiia bacterium]|nr:hypothetical protein [Acidimicrobiia bacterium]